ncbi:MAG TPA: hypothetical protein VGJ15_11170 [Pirellulales bacterium]
MTSPAQSVAYSFWLKARWMFALVFGTMLIFAVASLAMVWAREFILAAYLNVMVFELVFMLNVFVYGTADFGSKTSAFPKHMLVLPATTWQLVGWPMLFCSVYFAGMWVLSAGLLLLPAGFHPPMIWPATTMAAVVAWIQAISWSPFPTPLARVPAMVAALGPLFLLAAWAGFNQANNPVLMLIAAGNLAWLLVAYCVGVNGLSRTRAGKESDLFASIWKMWSTKFGSGFAAQADGQPPFCSPFAAQMWHECRRNVRLLPIMMAFVCVPMLPLVCLPIFAQTGNPGLMMGSTTISPSMLGLGLFIVFPLMISLMSSASFGKLDCWGKTELSSFFATRPIATTNYVRVKIVAAVIVAFLCWAIVLTFFAIWAGLEASSLNQHESLIRKSLSQATPRSIAAVLLGILALMFFTWRNLASGMWLVLCGRKWVANLIGFGSMGVMFIGGLVAWWILRHPEIQPQMLVFAPWLCGSALAIKFGITAAAMVALAHRNLVPAKTALLILLGWFATALAVFGVISYVFSPSWVAATAVLFALPLDAIAMAPLALYWNRHR